MEYEITLSAMFSELETIVRADALRLGAIYGGDAMTWLTEIELDALPVTATMKVFFEYAVNARLPRGFIIDDDMHAMTDYFLEMIPRSPMIELNAETKIAGICASIVERANARWQFDNEAPTYSIRELAILARMDERSVRNAAHPKLPGPLKTFRDSEGQTRVARPDALVWLEGRRGFKKTTYFDTSGAPSIPPDGFEDLADLCAFIRERCERSGKPIEKVLKKAGMEAEFKAWSDGQTGPARFDVARLSKLATALETEQKPFVIAACKGYQRSELASVAKVIDD